MHMNVCPPVYMCMPGACKGQKKALDPLKLELLMVMSHNGNQTSGLCRSSLCTEPLSHLLEPLYVLR